jgi:hypothetical protein
VFVDEIHKELVTPGFQDRWNLKFQNDCFARRNRDISEAATQFDLLPNPRLDQSHFSPQVHTLIVLGA